MAAGGQVPGTVTGATAAGGAGRVVFVFPGQGAQWAGMGRELAECSPVFASRLAECELALAPWVDWSLREVLAGAGGAPALEAAEVVQPALWAVMVSLAAVWEAAGVVPDAVVGHSQGEIAAACVAGMLSLRDAAAVVALRGQALSALDLQGGMVSVVMPAAAVRELVEPWAGRLSVAAVNGPAAVVVSGDLEALGEFEAELSARRVLRWPIPASDFVAHSPRVAEIEQDLLADLAFIRPAPGRIRLLSTAEGRWVDGPELDAAYWYANVRNTVRFDEAIRSLADTGHRVFIEVSPHPVLTAGTAETLEEREVTGTAVTGTLARDDAGARGLLASLARAHVAGAGVDWAAVLGGGKLTRLPTYAFQRQRYWPVPEVAAPGLVIGADGAGTAAETRFWAAVEGGDLPELARTLAIHDERGLGELLPALSSWRRRERDRSVTSGWRYRVTWAPVTEPGSGLLSGRWLVIAPAGAAGDLTDASVRALTARGARVVLAEIATGETATGEIDRADLAGRITAALAAVGDGASGSSAAGGLEQVSGVLSLLALDEAPLAGHPAVPGGLAATVALVQALGEAGITAPAWVATRGAVAAVPGEVLASPVQAQAWGAGRVAALEHPDRWGGLIDLPPVLDERAGAWLCAVLAGCGEDQVAVRAAGIFGRRLTRAPRPRELAAWSPRGTALVTGGSGAVAGHLARWLASQRAPRVVLASRSGPGAGGAARLAAELAARGSAAEVMVCDSGRRAQVAGLLDRFGASGPPLTAVLHTAGIVRDVPLEETDAAALEALLAPKAAGAALLDELTAGLDLDAFVLFSSIAATWGSGQQTAYAAANAFLDALAENRRSRGLPATSVAWGPWGGGGMSAGAHAIGHLRKRGVEVMDHALSTRALAQALAAGETTLTVADVDWSRFAPPFTLRRGSALIGSLPEVRQVLTEAAAGESEPHATDAAAELSQRLARLPRAGQDRLLTDLVRGEAAAVLRHASPESVEPRRAFSDLGLDSLTTLELRNRLAAATGLRLPATLVFDYANPAALAGRLRSDIVQDEGTGSPAVLTELDKLESLLSGLSGRGGETAEITARLEAVLSKWKEKRERMEPIDVSEKLESSTDDEIFDFIGKELGIS